MRFIAWLNAHALDWAEAGQVPNVAHQQVWLVHSQLCAENLCTTVISATQAVMLGVATPSATVGVMSAQVDQLVAGG